MKFILGTRGSKLALAQAQLVRVAFEHIDPTVQIEIKTIMTRGDREAGKAVTDLGGKGASTFDIELALQSGAIDLAVHSMKDFPVHVPAGLRIGCIPLREDARDALISRRWATLEEIPSNARWGTSSLRRIAQLRHGRPICAIIPMRGNVDTRLRKLDAGEADVILLAAAGLLRLGQREQHMLWLDPAMMIPAAGQGALCIEVAESTKFPAALLARLQHAETATCVNAERAALRVMSGSCQVPIGIYAVNHGGKIRIDGCVASPDGALLIRGHQEGAPTEAITLAETLGHELLQRGGQKILDALARGPRQP